MLIYFQVVLAYIGKPKTIRINFTLSILWYIFTLKFHTVKLARIVIQVVLLSICISANAQNDSTAIEHDRIGESETSKVLSEGERLIKINPDMALEYGLRALIISKQNRNVQDEASAFRLMAEANSSLNQIENSIRYFNRALSIYEQHGTNEQQIIILMGIAKVYISTKNSELAQQFLEKADRISGNSVNINIRTELQMLLGKIYMDQNKHKNAQFIFNRIITTATSSQGKQLKDKDHVLINCYLQLGLANKNMGNFDESLISYKNATEYALRLRDTITYAQTLRELALAYYLLEQYGEAFQHFNLAYSTSNRQNDTIGMIQSLQGMGDVHFERAEIYQAIRLYTRQQTLSEQFGDIPNTVTAMVKLSQCYYANNDYPASSAILNRALDLATKEKLTGSKADVYRYLALLYEKNGRFKNALECYKMWVDLRDSIYSNITGQKLEKLQILYDITQKERENESLRQNAEIQKLQLAKSRYQLIVLLSLTVAFTLVILFLVLLFREKQKEMKKQDETKQKISELNKELEKRMIQEIKKQEKQQQLLAQKSKLESLGNLAAGIAHEINQPLGGISMGIDNIMLRIQDHTCNEEYLNSKLNNLLYNIERIKKIIDHIRNFSRAQKPINYEQVNVNDVVSNALFMVSAQYENHGVSLTKSLDEQIGLITADKYKLEQVLLNLLSNAKYAVDEKSKLQGNSNYRKLIEIKTWKDRENIYISVKDNGTGIPQKVIDKIFDPFFTTKEEEQGTGLGLAISYGFIKDFLGELKVDSKEGEFTYFEIEIPRA